MPLILSVGGVVILIAALFTHLNRKVTKLMVTVAEFNAHLDSIESGVAELAVIVKDLKAGGLVSQAQLDAFDEKAFKILADIAAAK